MRIVVTGGAGFIGAHSCRALLEAGHAVTALDDLSHGKREAVPQGADFLVMDVRSPQLAAELERLRPDAVLHLAAQMDVRRSVADPTGEAGVVAIFLHRMLHGGDPVVNGDGGQTRDFVYVEDVARANLLALISAAQGALNVGTGVETSVNGLASILADAVGYQKPIAHGPAAPGEQRRSSNDPRAAAAQLGWEPRVPLDEGLRRTAQWFRNRA